MHARQCHFHDNKQFYNDPYSDKQISYNHSWKWIM